MFTLSVIFISIFHNQVGFLTNQFVEGKLICQQGETLFISEDDVKKTYHIFTLPEGDWQCHIVAYGDGILFPSAKDIVIKNIVL